MDAIKSTPYALQKPGQSTPKANPDKPKPEAVAQHNKAELQVRTTTNAQGEALGQRINFTA